MPKVEWFGQAGHFVDAKACRFHLHTHVAGVCVSTVGEYGPSDWPKNLKMTAPLTTNPDALYETAVFKIREDGETEGEPINMKHWKTRDVANAMHAQTVNDYTEEK